MEAAGPRPGLVGGAAAWRRPLVLQIQPPTLLFPVAQPSGRPSGLAGVAASPFTCRWESNHLLVATLASEEAEQVSCRSPYRFQEFRGLRRCSSSLWLAQWRLVVPTTAKRLVNLTAPPAPTQPEAGPGARSAPPWQPLLPMRLNSASPSGARMRTTALVCPKPASRAAWLRPDSAGWGRSGCLTLNRAAGGTWQPIRAAFDDLADSGRERPAGGRRQWPKQPARACWSFDVHAGRWSSPARPAHHQRDSAPPVLTPSADQPAQHLWFAGPRGQSHHARYYPPIARGPYPNSLALLVKGDKWTDSHGPHRESADKVLDQPGWGVLDRPLRRLHRLGGLARRGSDGQWGRGRCGRLRRRRGIVVARPAKARRRAGGD